MGSPDSEEGRLASEGPQTQVTISQGFWIGRYEVTQGEYLEVVGSNPSWFNGNRTSGPNWAFPAGNYGTNLMRPVDTVDQPSARNYCSLLTAREQAAGQLPAGYVYRLPTEAEWEYACRAGTTTRFSYGDDPSYSELGNYAWYNANSGNQTHPVGQKLPNPWGLYDMHGNLVEWSLDWYAGSLPGGSVTDPIGPASGSQIVHHSGTWGTPGDYLRSAWRGASPPTGMTNPGHGFRVVLARPLP
jgi:formylglycine-generating enzyme required for sulfatase activity